MTFDWFKFLTNPVGWILALFLCVGCNAHTEGESAADRQTKHDHNMENAKALVDLGKESGAAYSLTVRSTGKPSGGMENKFVFDTGIEATLTIFGNMGVSNDRVDKLLKILDPQSVTEPPKSEPAPPAGPLSGYPPGSRILETICIPPDPADDCDEPVVTEPPQRIAAK